MSQHRTRHGGAAPAATSSPASPSPRRCASAAGACSWLGTPGSMENQLVPPRGIAFEPIAFARRARQGPARRWCCCRCACCARSGRCLARRAPRAARRGARHGRLRLLSRRHDGVAARQAAGAGQADASLLLGNKALLPVADRVAFGFAGDGGARRPSARSSPAIRCAPRSRRCPTPAARFAGRSGAAAPAGRRRQPGREGAQRHACRRRWRCIAPAQRPQRHAPERRQADRRACAPPTPPPASRPRCCPSSTTWRARLAECDLIVCRAGAITVSELCAAGVAAVLVPLVVSTTSHQRDNARFLAARGGGDPPAAEPS